MGGWVVVGLVLAAVLVGAAAKLFGRTDRSAAVDTLKGDVAVIKAEADSRLSAELALVNIDRQELEEISKIEDDETRLVALARYGNRRR
jgi:hypothetical protein